MPCIDQPGTDEEMCAPVELRGSCGVRHGCLCWGIESWCVDMRHSLPGGSIKRPVCNEGGGERG